MEGGRKNKISVRLLQSLGKEKKGNFNHPSNNADAFSLSSNAHEPTEKPRFGPPRSIGGQLRASPYARGGATCIRFASSPGVPHVDFREVGTAEGYPGRLANLCKRTAVFARSRSDERSTRNAR